MNRTSRNIKKRVIAILLTLLIVLNGIPGQVFAGDRSTQEFGNYIIEVCDKNGNPVQEAAVSCNMTIIETVPGSDMQSETYESRELRTGENGICIIDLETLLTPGQEDGTRSIQMDVTVFAEGYEMKTIQNIRIVSGVANDRLVVSLENKKYTVMASAGEGGSIRLNEETGNSIQAERDSQVQLTVTPDAGYQILTVLVNDVPQVVADPNAFSTEVTVTGDMTVTAAFVRIYTVTVHYDNTRGTIETQPSSSGGTIGAEKVTAEDGTAIQITATPNELYRVAGVVLKQGETVVADESYTDNTYTNANPYQKTITADADYELEITFAYQMQRVIAETPEHGTLQVSEEAVEYGGRSTVTMKPEQNYHIKEIRINDTLMQETECENGQEAEDGTFRFDLVNICEDKRIQVIFEENEEISFENGVTFNSTDAIRKEGTNQYIYAKDARVIFRAADGLEIRITDDKNQEIKWNSGTKVIELTETTIIQRIRVRKAGFFSFIYKWADVALPDDQLKIVIDKEASVLTMTPDAANEYGYYNGDVNVQLQAEEAGIPDETNAGLSGCSGISKVEYWVTCDGVITQGKGYTDGDTTDDGILYEAMSGETVQTSVAESMTVKAEGNNSDNTVLHVAVTDRAGNTREEQLTLKINTTAPEVSYVMEGTKAAEAMDGYYNTDRTAVITYTDRAGSFDKTLAFDGIKIFARDAEGNEIPMQAEYLNPVWQEDGDTHILTLTFSQDANYEWTISYTNKAGLEAQKVTGTGEDLQTFTVDKTAPQGTISVNENGWSELLQKLTFGIYQNKTTTVVAEGTDATSPLYEVQYYKSDSAEVLGKAELEALYAQGSFTQERIKAEQDEAFAVYARITDYAGNTAYIGTNGVVVDMTESLITVTLDKPNEYGFYNSDVTVKVNVNELNEEETKDYSGIKQVDYTVSMLKDGSRVVTQQGNLYTFDNAAPTKDQLVQMVEKEFTVSKDRNNADDVQVTIIAEDNAGNRATRTVPVNINATAPKVRITIDGIAGQVSEGRGYYNTNRTAVITIEDRSSTFDPDAATVGIEIQAEDRNGEPIELDTATMFSGWKSDGDIHTASVTFTQDGYYTWSFHYENKAGLANEAITVDGENPYVFAIDREAPDGTVTIQETTWNKLLKALTFGRYSKQKVRVRMSAEDVVSPCVIEYYKTSDAQAKTAAELDTIYNAGSFQTYPDGGFEVGNEQFVIYARVTDYAGNYRYISSDGFIVDTTGCGITLIPSESNGFYSKGNATYGLYNQKSGVEVQVHVQDQGAYSGIKTVDYWIEKDGVKTQSGNLFTYTKINPAMKDLVNDWKGKISVDKAKNNSCNVAVYVKVCDNAGNETVQSVKLDIDNTAPQIQVTYQDKVNADASSGYFKARTATVVITERSHHFDSNAATKGIVITATDARGKAVENAYTISSWKTVENKKNPDAATHTAVITYQKDANYTVSVSYKDLAGNKNATVNTNGQKSPYKFTVDKTAPTGSVQAVSAEGRTAEWSGLRAVLTYGFCSKQEITVSCTKEDLTSPIKSVDYYVDKVEDTAQNTVAGVKPLTRKELDSITGWQTFRELKLTDNVQGVVYVRIRDKAGNYTYLSTDGLMIDKQNPLVEYIAPEVSVDPEKPVNGIYRDDVKVDLSISDPVIGGTCSGLGRISYRIYNRAVNAEKPTQSGDLYVQDANKQTAEGLLRKWRGSVTVDSTLNNSNDVLIVITARDNAGNSVQAEQTIRIDKTAPKIQVRYDNNQAVNDTYFRGDRHAYVSITERNFDPSAVQLSITNTDGVMPEISDWSRQDGSGNQDDTVWTAVITYQADGDYTFGIRYTDMAGNPAEGVEYAAGTAAPEAFTIDKTVPVVSVSYDNRDARNGNYYNAARTATITVTEHNFNADLVDIRVTATRDGAEAARPSVSGWQQDGDRHTATITYSGDALYTFQLAVRDMVGNEAERYPEESFYIDTTAPELEIQNIADQVAYNGEVKPVITGSDANYDPENLTVQLIGANHGTIEPEGTYTQTQNGGTFAFRNFANTKEADDIYILQASLTDRAGNTTTKEVSFSVNRFGSTYEFGDVAKRFNSSYVKDAEDVVITEVNANALKNIRLTLFKNNQTIVLTEGTDYRMDVTGGNGNWYRYVYTIFKKNFKDDGAYRLNIHSEDGAGNVAENTLDTKGAELRFGVDKTAPNIVLLNLESHKTYAVDQMTAEVSASDNLLLKTVTVYLDDYSQPYRTWNEKEVAEMTAGNQPYTFDISGDSIHAHNVKVVTTDAAGNEQTAEARGFFVTTNLWIRYYTNKGLFFGTIGGVIGLAAFIVFLIILKRRRREG